MFRTVVRVDNFFYIPNISIIFLLKWYTHTHTYVLLKQHVCAMRYRETFWGSKNIYYKNKLHNIMYMLNENWSSTKRPIRSGGWYRRDERQLLRFGRSRIMSGTAWLVMLSLCRIQLPPVIFITILCTHNFYLIFLLLLRCVLVLTFILSANERFGVFF